jgi:chemotaxis signal transduction protein
MAMRAALPHPEPLADLADAWTGVELAGEIVAFRYDIVERVLSAGAVTALPFAPEGVEGVVSVAGEVLPVVALRALLFPDRPAPGDHGNELVIVGIAGQRFALRVDGVAFVAAPLADRLPAAEPNDGTSEGSAEWRGRRVACLAAERLGLEGLRPRVPPSGAPGIVANGRIDGAAAPVNSSTEMVLAVTAGGLECGVPAGAVAELLAELIVTPVPLVPPVLLGVAVLRRIPVPVLSLARLLGGSAIGKIRGYIVVTAGAGRLVLAVEAIGGLRRADAALRIFDPARAIDTSLLALATSLATDGAEQAMAARGGRFLSLTIGGRFCAVPLADVDRIHAPRPAIRLPAGVASGIDGAVEVGGRIIPLTEGRRWLALPPGERPAGAHVVLRRDGERRVLAVDAVHRVVTIPEHDILQAGDSGQPVAAIGRVGDRSIVILSAAQVMSGESVA